MPLTPPTPAMPLEAMGEPAPPGATSTSGSSAHGGRSRAPSAPVLDERLCELFLLIGELRGASAQHLHALFFARRYEDRDTGKPISERSTRTRIAALVDDGHLARVEIPGTRRVLLQLTERGRTAFPVVANALTEHVRKPLPSEMAAWAWQRAALWAALTEDGYRVGRDVAALRALRRDLVDRQQARVEGAKEKTEREKAEKVLRELRSSALLTPWTAVSCPKCGTKLPLLERPQSSRCACGGTFQQRVIETPHSCASCGARAEHFGAHVDERVGNTCGGRLRPVQALPFDVAHRVVDGRHDVLVLLVDNPRRSVESQLDELPLRFLGQPKVRLVVWPSDDDSAYDIDAGEWAAMGPRLRALRRAFDPSAPPRKGAFPFWLAAEVEPTRLDLTFRAFSRKSSSHA